MGRAEKRSSVGLRLATVSGAPPFDRDVASRWPRRSLRVHRRVRVRDVRGRRPARADADPDAPPTDASRAEAFFRFDAGSNHTNNWAVLVDTSRYWFNYRHVANTLSFYRTVKRLGIPDSRIILMLADDMACNPRNAFPGAIFGNVNHEVDLYGENVEVDYRGYEVTPENLIRVLTDRHPPGVPRSKRLLTDAGSNVLLYLTGHGGDEFLKFQDQHEIVSRDIADALAQMRAKGRYNEVLFIADTCQASTLGAQVRSPGVLAVGSSEKGENSYSHHHDFSVGLSVIDRSTYHTLEFMEKVEPHSRATAKEWFEQLTFPKLRSHAKPQTGNYARRLEETRVVDFFGVGDARDACPPRVRRAGRRETRTRRRPAEVRSRGGRVPTGGCTRDVHRGGVSRRGEGEERRAGSDFVEIRVGGADGGGAPPSPPSSRGDDATSKERRRPRTEDEKTHEQSHVAHTHTRNWKRRVDSYPRARREGVCFWRRRKTPRISRTRPVPDPTRVPPPRTPPPPPSRRVADLPLFPAASMNVSRDASISGPCSGATTAAANRRRRRARRRFALFQDAKGLLPRVVNLPPHGRRAQKHELVRARLRVDDRERGGVTQRLGAIAKTPRVHQHRLARDGPIPPVVDGVDGTGAVALAGLRGIGFAENLRAGNQRDVAASRRRRGIRERERRDDRGGGRRRPVPSPSAAFAEEAFAFDSVPGFRLDLIFRRFAAGLDLGAGFRGRVGSTTRVEGGRVAEGSTRSSEESDGGRGGSGGAGAAADVSRRNVAGTGALEDDGPPGADSMRDSGMSRSRSSPRRAEVRGGGEPSRSETSVGAGARRVRATTAPRTSFASSSSSRLNSSRLTWWSFGA